MKFLRAYLAAYPEFVDVQLLKETAQHFGLLIVEIGWLILSPLLVFIYVLRKPGAWDRWFFERRR